MHWICSSARLGAGGRTIAAAAAVVAALAWTPAVAHAEAEPVRAAAQTDPGSGRLVLELRRPLPYTVEQSPPYVFLRFSRPIAGDFEAHQKTLNRYLAELRLAGGGRVLVLRIIGQPRFIHYRRGNSVVLTWIGSGHRAQPPAENPTDSKAPPASPSQRADAGPKRTPPGRPAPPPAARSDRPPIARAEATPPAPPPPDDATPPAKGKDAEAKSEADKKAADPPQRETAALTPKLVVVRNGGETRLAVAWPEPTAAAVFRTGDWIWIVFPRREAFDLSRARQQLGPGVERLGRIEHAEATVLAARVAADVHARVSHERNVWMVTLKRDNAPAREAGVKIAISRGEHEQVAVPLPGAEAPIRVLDPELGMSFFVVPSRALARAAGERRFVAFRLVPAVQGAAVEMLADGLEVTAAGGAVVIRRPGGLLLSASGRLRSAQRP